MNSEKVEKINSNDDEAQQWGGETPPHAEPLPPSASRAPARFAADRLGFEPFDYAERS